VFEEYVEVAYNYRMTDIQAAVGREQLKRLDTMLAKRRKLAAKYLDQLSDIRSVELPAEPEYARTNWQTFLIRLPGGLDQRRVMQALRDKGVSTRRGIMCAHREPGYREVEWSCAKRKDCDCPPSTCVALSQSESAQDCCIALPLFSTMTDHQQDHVIKSLAQVIKDESKDTYANTVS
jgi:dTDP-4-amino-4,6-dideoxygalactose transaminase